MKAPRICRFACVAAAASISVPLPLVVCAAQATPPCDTALKPTRDQQTAYQERPAPPDADQRCEGFYELPVSTQRREPHVSVLGCYLEAAPFAPGENTIIDVMWPSQSADVRIRAVPADASKLYQMDALKTAADQGRTARFRWHTNVLAKAVESSHDIRLTAWLEKAPMIGSENTSLASMIILPIVMNLPLTEEPGEPPAEQHEEPELASIELTIRNDGPTLQDVRATWVRVRTSEEAPAGLRSPSLSSRTSHQFNSKVPATGDDWALRITAADPQSRPSERIELPDIYVRMPDRAFMRLVKETAAQGEDAP